ncbi:hypothetical protein CMV46_16050 [Escherichia coli]|uniref:Uncharacterized protein n=1 Tax=Escherichia coli TaxID=562 RepID=A0AAI8DYU7_ECOLX|nr:hypothetical protein CMV46_16050 [Escherichia coli]RJJ97694.1 hypothetical protein CMV44_05340 [Escherichia coli]
MAHPLTNTGGEYHHAASRGLLACFLFAGGHDVNHARLCGAQGDKTPDVFIQVVRVPPLRVYGIISHSCLDNLAIVGG